MSIPPRLLQELGEIANRYNLRTARQEHTASCCPVERRGFRDLMQCLMDETNWLAEPVSRQIEKLRDELEALKERNGAAYSGAERVSPVPPIEPETENPAGDFFTPPPPRGDDE